jgi:hypothetical protein
MELDWEAELPIEHLRCAECSYQLFGLQEKRCPECGTPFEWSEALAVARTRVNRLFEFLWFDNPVPGLMRSMWLAGFRPTKLWAQYDLHARPKVVALLLLILVQWLLFARGWHIIAWMADPAMNGISVWLGSRIRFVYRFRVDAWFLPFMAVVCIVTFASIQLFFQTKRRLGIRWTDTLRVYAHATVFASFCTTGWCILEVLLDATLFFTPALARASVAAYPMLAHTVFAIGLIVTWAHLSIGFRRYLKFPHVLGISAACLLIGHLAGLIVFSMFMP